MGQPTMRRPPILRGREAMMVADCLVPDAQRAASAITALVNQVGRYERALREIRMLTVEVGDSVEAASRACAIAMEALDE